MIDRRVLGRGNGGTSIDGHGALVAAVAVAGNGALIAGDRHSAAQHEFNTASIGAKHGHAIAVI